MPHAVSTLALFDRAYAETVELIREASVYLRDGHRQGPRGAHAAVQLVASCETMRLTARLAQVHAWLLLQRAILAGEMTAQEPATDMRRLGGRSVCAVEGPWRELGLPVRLQSLLARSLALYNRIARLDDLAAGALKPAND